MYVINLAVSIVISGVSDVMSVQLSEGSLVRASITICPRFLGLWLGLGLVKWTLGQVDPRTNDYEPAT